MTFSRFLRLSPTFDTALLQQDLALICSDEWVSHFNHTSAETGWSCVSLRAVGGDQRHIIPFDHQAFEDTPVLQRCSYFREVIDDFCCEKKSVRLMALAPGADIKPHRDPGTSLSQGLARLHIPVQTSAEVEFLVEGEAVYFAPGQTWYLDASCEHAVVNRSKQARIHLVMDCVRNLWLESLFAQAGFVAAQASKYGDPNITDANVFHVIRILQLQQNPASLACATRLQTIASQHGITDQGGQ
jgi:hypothetical protein